MFKDDGGCEGEEEEEWVRGKGTGRAGVGLERYVGKEEKKKFF